MPTLPRFALALPIVALLLGGCGKDSSITGPPGTAQGNPEETQVRDELTRHPELVDDGLSESEAQTAAEAAAAPGAGPLAAIRPLFFWRHITDVERRFEFAFADTDSAGRPTAVVVTVHKFLRGTFNLVVSDGTGEGDPTTGHVIRKPLHDHAVRRILLRRVAVANSDRTLWKIVASSAVKITSREAVTRIESLRVQSGALDTTLTNPLELFRLRRILRLEPGTEVTLTVSTLTHDDAVFLYARSARFRFHNQGDNTYVGTWKVPAVEEGVHHFGVNALSHGSLFDDEAPYDSQAWVLPFVIRPTELAEFAP